MLMVEVCSHNFLKSSCCVETTCTVKPGLLQMRRLAIVFWVVGYLFRQQLQRARTSTVLCWVILTWELSPADSSLTAYRLLITN